MRLSLLRGSIRPDPDSDLGEHSFTYALLPHDGIWQEADTVPAACELNCPLTVVEVDRHRGALPPMYLYLRLYGPAHVGALKPAEDGEGCVLRLVEQHGARGDVTVAFDREVASLHGCDLLERPEQDVKAEGDRFTTSIHPFEIKAFRLRLA